MNEVTDRKPYTFQRELAAAHKAKIVREF
uniref:Uncharacterized protein n=1 Tax=Lepeophtheirus salmonis TaxID=72036 RepID=A0A0K2TZZ5_LEPSM